MSDERLDHLHRRVSNALADWFHNREPCAGLALDEAVQTALIAAYHAGKDAAMMKVKQMLDEEPAFFGWLRKATLRYVLFEKQK